MDKSVQILAQELHMLPAHVQNVIEMLDAGDTVPFIARYRKEKHGTTDDQTLRTLSERLTYLRNLDARREEVSSAITQQEKMTDEIASQIENAKTLAELEDIYRPFRPKRRTRATIAKEKGLEPSIEQAAKDYINEEKGVATAEDALAGASDIIAERISDDAAIRQRLKDGLRRLAFLKTEATGEDAGVYAMYADYK